MYEGTTQVSPQVVPHTAYVNRKLTFCVYFCLWSGQEKLKKPKRNYSPDQGDQLSGEGLLLRAAHPENDAGAPLGAGGGCACAFDPPRPAWPEQWGPFSLLYIIIYCPPSKPLCRTPEQPSVPELTVHVRK